MIAYGGLFCVPLTSSQAAAGYDRGSVVIRPDKSSFQQGSKILMETVNLHFRFGFFAGLVVIVRESH